MLAKYALLAPANDNFKLPALIIDTAKLAIVTSKLEAFAAKVDEFAAQSEPAPPAWVASSSAPSPAPISLDRDTAIRRIKSALKARSGKSWSVTGGKGTAWGWIKIDTMPARKRFDCEGNPTDSEFGYMSKDERTELAALLGLDTMHCQGVDIPASSAYRVEYVARAEGRSPERYGEQYWD